MEIAKLVLEYVKALAWPTFAAWLLWLLRAQLGQAIGRLSRLETPAGTVEFAADAAHVRNEAEELASSDEASDIPTTPRPSDQHAEGASTDPKAAPGQPREAERDRETSGVLAHDWARAMGLPPGSSWASEWGPDAAYRNLIVLARDDPKGAVRDAWRLLNLDIGAALVLRGHLPEGAHLPRSTPFSEEILRAAGLSMNAMAIYQRLYHLNQRAGITMDDITFASAVDFVRSCRNVSLGLRRSGS